MKKLISLLISIGLFLGATGCFGSDQKNKTGDVLKVGLILPITGSAASVGTSARNAAEMSYGSLPSATQKKIDMVFEDNQLSPANSVNIFQKLVSVDKVGAVVTITSGPSNAVAPLAEEKKMPLIAVAADRKIVEGRNYAVKHWVTPEEEMEVIIPEIKKRGYQKIAMIIAQHDGYVYFMNDFKERIKKEGIAGRFVMEEWFNPDIRDFRSFIAKAKEKQADAIGVLLLSGQIGLFAKQTREMGLDVPLFGIDYFEDKKELEAAGGALEGQWYVCADDADQRFYQEYEQKYQSFPSLGAANMYDIIQIIGESVEKYGSDSEKLNWYLHNLKDFHGVVGTYSASGKNDFTLPAEIKVIKNGKFEPLYPK